MTTLEHDPARAPARQDWSPEGYARNARFVATMAGEIVDWLAPKPGERILDLGCGDGVLTKRIAEAGAEVTGVDASPDFVEATRALGLDARVVDGHALPFREEFDAVFSNAALHWMRGADQVAAGVAAALKPGGRFVGEMGGHLNVASIVTALLSVARRHGLDESLAFPWYFPTAEEYTAVLEGAGLAVDRAVLVPRQTPLPTGIKGWLATFREPFFEGAGARKDAVLDEVEALLAPSLRDRAGNWTADYVRLRFLARKPS